MPAVDSVTTTTMTSAAASPARMNRRTSALEPQFKVSLPLFIPIPIPIPVLDVPSRRLSLTSLMGFVKGTESTARRSYPEVVGQAEIGFDDFVGNEATCSCVDVVELVLGVGYLTSGEQQTGCTGLPLAGSYVACNRYVGKKPGEFAEQFDHVCGGEDVVSAGDMPQLRCGEDGLDRFLACVGASGDRVREVVDP